MSYLSPSPHEPVSDNMRQPTDMTHEDWACTMYAGAQAPSQAGQGSPWFRRRRPGLRPPAGEDRA